MSRLVLLTSYRCVSTGPLVIFLVPHGVALFAHGMIFVVFGEAIVSSELDALFLALS